MMEDRLLLHPEPPEIFGTYGTVSFFKKGIFGPDMTSNLAGMLFGFDHATFVQVPTEQDPRGFVELYGGIAEQEYSLQTDTEILTYKTLACFCTHFSFVLKRQRIYAVTVTPSPYGLAMLIMDVHTGEILDSSEPSVPVMGGTSTGFPDFLLSRIKLAEEKLNANNKEGKAE